MGDIAEFYTELRGAEDADALPITVRSLETIIRMSTAVAKSRLAKGERPVHRPAPQRRLGGWGVARLPVAPPRLHARGLAAAQRWHERACIAVEHRPTQGGAARCWLHCACWWWAGMHTLTFTAPGTAGLPSSVVRCCDHDLPGQRRALSSPILSCHALGRPCRALAHHAQGGHPAAASSSPRVQPARPGLLEADRVPGQEVRCPAGCACAPPGQGQRASGLAVAQLSTRTAKHAGDRLIEGQVRPLQPLLASRQEPALTPAAHQAWSSATWRWRWT